MIEYLERNGITYTHTAPYTPEQNGIAERMNRSLIEMIRSMLTAAHLDLKFWVEALHAASDIKNCVLTSALGQVTPYERLVG